MKRALIITTLSGFVPQFEANNVKILQELGYEVHYASNFKMPFYGNDNKRVENMNVICHQIDFERSPYHIIKNHRVYKTLKKLSEQAEFNIVHCHTPMGGVMGRMVFRTIQRARVIYTVHGFHFYKGAPLKNRLLYYPLERFLAKYTDILITINQNSSRIFLSQRLYIQANIEFQ